MGELNALFMELETWQRVTFAVTVWLTVKYMAGWLAKKYYGRRKKG